MPRRRPKKRFVDVMKEDMGVVGVSQEDAKETVMEMDGLL